MSGGDESLLVVNGGSDDEIEKIYERKLRKGIRFEDRTRDKKRRKKGRQEERREITDDMK